MEIAKYTAGFSITFPQSEMAKLDAQLRIIESKIKTSGMKLNQGFNLNLARFNVNQKNLDIALGTALDIASARTVFHVSRFSVDQMHLNNTMIHAMTLASRVAGSMVIRQGVGSVPRGEGGGRTSTRSAAVSGGIAGGLGSLFPIALAAGLGGYGLSSLNKINQKVVAAELQSQAVVTQAGGTTEQGTDSFNWLRKQANRIGFNYLDATQGYNNTLAGLTHAGMTVAQGQNVFKGFSEIGRVMKLDAPHQKRLLYAVSEVADMNELQKRQMNMIALALPGGKSLFAEAWQKQTGGKLTGQQAEDALLKAIKGRQVKGNILTEAADIASERAAPSLEKASQASQAEQSRYQNSIADLAKVASEAGVEEGFARIFRTLTAGLSESNDLVKGLAESFNEATKYASELLLFPQSFIRALEGKDSLVADWLGADRTKQLQEDWKNIKQIFTDISTIQFDFLPTLKSTADEIAMIMNAIAEFKRWKDGTLPTETKTLGEGDKIDPFGLGSYTSPKAIFDDVVNNTGVNMGKARQRGNAIYDDPTNLYYHDAAGYDTNQRDMAMAAADDAANGVVTNNNQFDVVINVDSSALGIEDSGRLANYIGEATKDHLTQLFGNTQTNFPQKE